ncbi:MAG: hypothetical protein S4CHLAM123_12490 [Chlamydiales bacterium]|nr:hypothetical protein [Chlamydiales bacterium]
MNPITHTHLPQQSSNYHQEIKTMAITLIVLSLLAVLCLTPPLVNILPSSTPWVLVGCVIFGGIFISNYQKIPDWVVRKAFFSNFGMKEQEKIKRRADLENLYTVNNLDARSLVSKKTIEAISINSEEVEKTNTTVIYVVPREYQRFHHRNYEHLLKAGVNVVLFNPTELKTTTMAKDLLQIIRKVEEQGKKVALYGYSIGAHAAAGAAVAHSEEDGIHIPVVVDRGYGNAQKLARALTVAIFAPGAKKAVSEHDCALDKRADKHKTDMLFISPQFGDDFLMHSKRKKFDLSQELQQAHNHGEDAMIRLNPGKGHWAPLTEEAANKTIAYLKKHKIFPNNLEPKFAEGLLTNEADDPYHHTLRSYFIPAIF